MQQDHDFSRRGFLKGAAVMGIGAASLPTIQVMDAVAKTNPSYASGTGLDLAVAMNGTPAKNTEAAIKVLGGIERFVKPGDVVVFKPNCISARAPEYAINTHPEVVRMVVRLCKQAGAKEVVAVSNDAPGNFNTSGIGEAIEQEGGSWEALRSPSDFREVLLPRGVLLRRTEILNRVLDADVFINLPIAKDHGGSRLTLGMKNYMGINYNRQIMHRMGLQQTIADLATALRPNLTIMDANYMLLSNGPGGPGNTRHQQTVIAGVDHVLVDAYTTTLFNMEPRELGHVQYASDMGLGSMDLNNARISEFNLQ